MIEVAPLTQDLKKQEDLVNVMFRESLSMNQLDNL